MHASLRHLLVCISFKWDIRRLIFLQATLQILSTYPAEVTVKVLSDQPDNVNKVITVWSQDLIFSKRHSFQVESEGPTSHLEHLLSAYMKSRHWKHVDDSPWGLTEMGSGSVQFVDVPTGFDGAGRKRDLLSVGGRSAKTRIK